MGLYLKMKMQKMSIELIIAHADKVETATMALVIRQTRNGNKSYVILLVFSVQSEAKVVYEVNMPSNTS